MAFKPIDAIKRSNNRTYSDGCAAAHGLDLIGERWALLIVRELVLGPKRFTDLRSGLPGISPNVLTQRLDELERASIVRRRKLAPPAAAWVYELTEWGMQLDPIIAALGRWAVQSPALPQGNPISIDALILSFRAMFDPNAAAGLDASIELRLREDTFHAEVRHGRLTIERGSADSPDATVATEPDTLAAIVYAGRTLADAIRSGEVKVDGDKATVKRFLNLFPLP